VRAPAVCDHCGSIFGSPFEFNNAHRVSFRNVNLPCPRCGRQAHVIEGTYNFIGNTIELLSGPQATRDRLQWLSDYFASVRELGVTTEDVRAEIHKTAPELASLADALPTNRAELYAFIAIILATLQLILAQVGGDTRIEIHQVINQITQQVPAPTPPRAVEVRSDVPASTARNTLCPCGSGKKYKKCHGQAH
jgi:hypothetical protein